MQPVFRLIADGTDVTANIRDRLLSLSFKDEAETKSDRLTVKLDDRPRDGAYVELPKIGTKLELALGYTGAGAPSGLVPMGSFTVDEIKYSGPVATLEIGAKAAGMQGPFRTPVSKSWSDTTLGAIAEAIAKDNGFTPVVSEKLASVKIDHADQTNESPMAFLNRLAGQYDAVAKPVDGKLVVAPKGTAKSATGKTLPDMTVTPPELSRWNYSYSARKEAGEADGDGEDDSGDGGKGGTKTVYWDKDEAVMKEVTEGKPPYQNVKFVTANPGEAAGKAATAKNEADRDKANFSCECIGNPKFAAEQKLILSGFRPGVTTEWRITSVEHKLDSGGYSCSIDAEVFQAKQADAAEKANSDPDGDVVQF